MAGLFDIFNNDNAQDAANAQIRALTQGYNSATGNLNAGIGAIKSGYGGASDALTTNFGNAGTALNTNYNAALQPFLKNYGVGSQGTTALADALGLNGGAGNAAATAAAYASNPAYQFQLQQGNENVLRNAARTGTTASGATDVALQQQGQGLANQTYQQYVQNLMPFLGYSSNAASGIGNIYTGLGSGLSNLSTGLGTGLANLSTGQGGALNSAYGNLANLGYNTAVGQGNAQANADLANNNASANMWNMILNGGKLAVGAFGGGGGGMTPMAGGGQTLGMGQTPLTPAQQAGAGGPMNMMQYGNGNYYPAYAEGGRPPTGKPVIVGEKGPELFVPDRPGTIVSNDNLRTRYASTLSRFLEAA